MQRKSAPAVHLWSLQVGQIAAVFNSGLAQLLERVFWIANSVCNDSATLQRTGWLEQKLHQLTRTLIITPVADPEDIGLLFFTSGSKNLGIGSFVKSPNPGHTESVRIDSTDGLAER